jgi:hypothetical protein
MVPNILFLLYILQKLMLPGYPIILSGSLSQCSGLMASPFDLEDYTCVHKKITTCPHLLQNYLKLSSSDPHNPL